MILSYLTIIVSSAIDKMRYFLKSKEAVLRSFTILDIFKTLLFEKNHAILHKNISELFPRLFSYESSGVMLMHD